MDVGEKTMVVGTIRNSVTLTMMDQKWQQKKSNYAVTKRSEMTAEERMLADFKDQALSIREGNARSALDAKLLSGGTLTAEEIEYLRKNDPQALRDYEERQQARKAYERQLKNCRSKEEVERVRTLKMGEELSKCKEISNNPYIPLAKKKELLEEIVMEVSGITKDHIEFLQSSQYASLPETDEEAREGDKQAQEITGEEASDAIAKDPTEEEAQVDDAVDDKQASKKGSASETEAETAEAQSENPGATSAETADVPDLI